MQLQLGGSKLGCGWAKTLMQSRHTLNEAVLAAGRTSCSCYLQVKLASEAGRQPHEGRLTCHHRRLARLAPVPAASWPAVVVGYHRLERLLGGQAVEHGARDGPSQARQRACCWHCCCCRAHRCYWRHCCWARCGLHCCWLRRWLRPSPPGWPRGGLCSWRGLRLPAASLRCWHLHTHSNNRMPKNSSRPCAEHTIG